MDKAGFIKALKQHLLILNEEEQKDILDEYEQHIDMKMEKGMSEAEAIQDFGNLKELAAEILEAYHVNPQYNGTKKVRKIPAEETLSEVKQSGKRIWTRALELIQRLWGKLKARAAAGKDWLKKTGSTWSTWEKKPRVESDLTVGKELVQKTSRQGWGKWKQAGRHMMKSIGSLFRSCLCVGLCGVRWIWNIVVMFFVFMAGAFTLAFVFTLGVLVILLIQGYPLAGVTIGALGLILCGAAVTILLIGLIKRKRSEAIPAEEVSLPIQEVADHA